MKDIEGGKKIFLILRNNFRMNFDGFPMHKEDSNDAHEHDLYYWKMFANFNKKFHYKVLASNTKSSSKKAL